MIHIRSLSSPEVHGITNAEVYSTLLLENFKNIGTLAEKNRDMIRSYSKGKMLSDYEQEVIRDAGTRYAPWGPELFKDEKVRRDLDYLLSEDRLKLYMETFKLLTTL